MIRSVNDGDWHNRIFGGKKKMKIKYGKVGEMLKEFANAYYILVIKWFDATYDIEQFHEKRDELIKQTEIKIIESLDV